MLDVPPPPDIGGLIKSLAEQFMSLMSVVLNTIDTTVVQLARLAYITVLLLGVLLYFTRVERRLGKDLIKGGVVLALLSEFVFPALVKI